MVKIKKKENDTLDIGFPKKWERVLPTGFSETAEGYSEEELKKTIIDSEKTINEVEVDQDADEKLATLKSDLKDISGSYKDLTKMHMAKIKFCLHVLKSRGNA